MTGQFIFSIHVLYVDSDDSHVHLALTTVVLAMLLTILIFDCVCIARSVTRLEIDGAAS